jgi:cbb3-type cytochrome oxidase subunit 3
VLPVILVLGALTKESFIPFSLVFMAVWWIVLRNTHKLRRCGA